MGPFLFYMECLS
uniref:Uncharacterized protein n=1 Tax=Lepeophtheirus salmonis TaxID=72036 RepID=A0A0K2UNW1_LEPSM